MSSPSPLPPSTPAARRSAVMRARAERARAFLERDIWEKNLDRLPRRQAAGYGFLRMAYIVGAGFARDKLQLRASALTFTTLVSIVPVLALAFSVAKGFGLGHRAQEAVLSKIPAGWPVELRGFVVGIFERIDATDFRALGTIGLLVLFVTAVRVLATIETTFNDIWGVQKGRTWARRFSDYLSVLVVMPILMFAATTANAFLASPLVISKLSAWAGPLLPLYLAALRLLPFFLLWTAFAAVYCFMPNTRVPFASALLGAVIAGSAWQILQWLYIHFQIGIARYNAIYGTFATLPIFLAWLQLSWMIVLFGAEVAFAHQHYRTFHEEGSSRRAPFLTREGLAIELSVETARRFLAGTGPLDADALAQERGVPIRLAREVLAALVAGGVLTEVQGTPTRYLPARDPAKIGAAEILAILRRHGEAVSTELSAAAQETLRKAQAGIESSLSGASLEALANGAAEKPA